MRCADTGQRPGQGLASVGYGVPSAVVTMAAASVPV